MKGQANWSPMQKMLFTSLVPVAAIVGALLLFSFLRSQPGPEPRAEPSGSLTAGRSTENARSAERETYRDCLRSMGADIGGTQYRSRFSPPPDMKKIREAMSVCRILLDTDGGPSPTPRTEIAPPIA